MRRFQTESGDTAYNTSRAADASKLGAGASTAILGAEKTIITNNLAKNTQSYTRR